MTLKIIEDLVDDLKAKYPKLSKSIDNETVELSTEEYEITILEWANNQLADQAKEAEIAQLVTDKKAATAKLAALGLTTEDLRALGL
jgi:uncharacterized Zn finger protein